MLRHCSILMPRWQSYTERMLQYPTPAYSALRKHDAFISWDLKAISSRIAEACFPLNSCFTSPRAPCLGPVGSHHRQHRGLPIAAAGAA